MLKTDNTPCPASGLIPQTLIIKQYCQKHSWKLSPLQTASSVEIYI